MKYVYGYRSDYWRGVAQRNRIININQFDTLPDKRISRGDNCFCNQLFLKNKLLSERLTVVNLYFMVLCFTASFLFLTAFAAAITFFLMSIKGIILK